MHCKTKTFEILTSTRRSSEQGQKLRQLYKDELAMTRDHYTWMPRSMNDRLTTQSNVAVTLNIQQMSA